MSRICFQQKSMNEMIYYPQHIWYFYFIVASGSNKNRLKANVRKFWLNFAEFVFRLGIDGRTLILQVKILYSSLFNFSYFDGFTSVIFIKISVWHKLQKCRKMLKIDIKHHISKFWLLTSYKFHVNRIRSIWVALYY